MKNLHEAIIDTKMPRSLKILITVAAVRLFLAMALMMVVAWNAHWSVSIALAWVLSETETAMFKRVTEKIKADTDRLSDQIMKAMKQG